MASFARASASAPRGTAASRRAISRSATRCASTAKSVEPNERKLVAAASSMGTEKERALCIIAERRWRLWSKRTDLDPLLGSLGIDDERLVRLNVDELVSDFRLGRQRKFLV